MGETARAAVSVPAPRNGGRSRRLDVGSARIGGGTQDWLLLSHWIPRGQGAAYMKVWRQLTALGAVRIHHGLAALPDSPMAEAELRAAADLIEAIPGAWASLMRSHVLSDSADRNAG